MYGNTDVTHDLSSKKLATCKGYRRCQCDFPGTRCQLLTGETQLVNIQCKALQMMSRIAEHMEQNIDYNTIFKKTDRNENPDITSTIAHATCLTAIDLKARQSLAVTKSGKYSSYDVQTQTLGCHSRCMYKL